MYMLRDYMDRKVVVAQKIPFEFFAQDGLQLVSVAKATVAKASGDEDLVIDKAYADKRFSDKGLDPNMYRFHAARNNDVILVDHQEHRQYSWAATSRPSQYTINGSRVDKAFYEKVVGVLNELNSYDWLLNGYLHLVPWNAERDIGRVNIDPPEVLEMIGEGGVVTPESLKKACAEGETRPRLWPGDTVEVKMSKKTVLGTVTGLGKKVSVLRQDGKKGTYAYSSVTRTDKVAYDEDAIAELDPTLAANFEYVLGQSHRIYKAALTIRDSVKFPAFPMPDDHRGSEITRENEPTCECPLCGWPMANFRNEGEFVCCFCRVRGIIAHQDADTVTLLMLRQPAKNRFCIREAKCCSNCGLFHFEYGRQGKRTTGYCRATNQCVQAFSTCVSADGTEGYWFPRTPTEYGKNMTQHTTNLGYGVSDARNTTRRDIRDTIYRKEDHEAEKKRAERAKFVYASAFAKFMDDLGKLSQGRMALSDDFTDGQKAELRQHFQEILDDGC